jgi:hypothetical protein
MLFMPTQVRPVSPEVRAGLVLSWSDVRKTGATRQGRPEYEIKRKLWFRGFEVPAGFVFDVHSLPRLLRPWQPRNPAWWGPAALHDWALESGLISIKEANQLYRCAMEDLGVRWLHRTVAFTGVEFARYCFPDRITCIDPDNAPLVEAASGREMVFKEDMPGIRKAVFMAAKAAARGYLATKGVPLP